MMVSGESTPPSRLRRGADIRREVKMKKSIRYTSDMPRRLYTFFHHFADVGAPSFSKFARSIGATVDDIESFRRHKEFECAYRECNEIRRDYLIDNALTKRFDSSLVKFLLTNEYGMEEKGSDEDRTLDVRLEVVGE